MKSNTRKVLLGAACLAAVAAAAPCANAANTAMPMSAKIIAAIAITQTGALDFGDVSVAAGTSGTVTVDNANTRAAGGAGGVSLIGGTGAQSGQFKMTAAKLAIDITLNTATATLKFGGANTLNVDKFTISGSAAGTGSAFVTTPTTSAVKAGFDVGGRLTIPGGHAAGTYAGSVTITANYQ